MHLTAAEIAGLVGGVVEGEPSVIVHGAEVDSRRTQAGDLFVALAGDRCDGHDFVLSALNVAAAALVRADRVLAPPPKNRALIRVDDPLSAYHELARHECRERSWDVVAVTGSVGKTTTKDFLALLLGSRLQTGASEGNRNSTLGLPAEVLSQGPGIEVFVAEAGMSSPGELRTLGEILRPRVVLYTRIAPVHTEFFPDLEGIVNAKAELLPWLDPDGTLVMNADDPWQRNFPGRTEAKVLSYGGPESKVRFEDIENRGLLGTSFRLVMPDGDAVIELGVPGLHQAENLLAAAAAAFSLGIGIEEVVATAPRLQPALHRGRILNLEDGILLVDDSYNASPVAVRRLLELLSIAPGRRVAVLGEMYELGEASAEAHRRTGEEAAIACDVLLAVGDRDAAILAKAACEGGIKEESVTVVANAEDATEVLQQLLRSGDVVLVKGSRGVGLDRTVDALCGEEVA